MSRKTFETRQSNIELLRIIAMFMIAFNHFSGHGVMHRLSESPYVIWAQGSVVNKLFSAFLRPGGEVGVGIFLSSQDTSAVKKIQERWLRLGYRRSFMAFINGCDRED